MLHWAWSLQEAGDAADAYREHGYLDVKVMNALTEKTVDYVHDLIIGILKEEDE